jgi:hypothetical protein
MEHPMDIATVSGHARRGRALLAIIGAALALAAALAATPAHAAAPPQASRAGAEAISTPAGGASAQELTWTVVPSPNVPNRGNSLAAVSCASAHFCVAVGAAAGKGVASQPLIETWNGTRWSIVPTPKPKYGRLSGVACVSATDCTAAGNYWPTPLKNTRDLVESWNGTRWSQSTVPDKGPLGGLFGVSCASAKFCTAVGDYGGGSSSSTLIETGTAGT